jgi:hypothetical protein
MDFGLILVLSLFCHHHVLVTVCFRVGIAFWDRCDWATSLGTRAFHDKGVRIISEGGLVYDVSVGLGYQCFSLFWALWGLCD